MEPDPLTEAARIAATIENDLARINRLAGLNGRADEAADRMRADLCDSVLDVARLTRIDVLLGTGGPGRHVNMRRSARLSAVPTGTACWPGRVGLTALQEMRVRFR